LLVEFKKYFVTFPKIKERYEITFYPFEVFSSKLELTDNDQLYVSADLKKSQDMLSKDPNDIVGMYNFFFDARISRENVYLGYSQKNLGSDLINRDFSYALLSENDVHQLVIIDLWDTVQEKFAYIYFDENETVYLLTY